MKRRYFIASMGVIPFFLSPALSNTEELSDLIKFAQSNPEVIEKSWLFRESSVSRGVGQGQASKRKLSSKSLELIVAFEVSSPEAYEKKYRKAIWPRGQSGVTIGIGYDLRFSNRNFVDRDWHMLPVGMRQELYTVVGLGGQEARRALVNVPSVDVSWENAKIQFLHFIQFQAALTERTFPHCDHLPDDSFGALVSLIYNRGAQIAKTGRRKEMYEIRELMRSRNFSDIPDRIRAMKRIWEGDKDAVGLLRRRDAEAALFEIGLEHR